MDLAELNNYITEHSLTLPYEATTNHMFTELMQQKLQPLMPESDNEQENTMSTRLEAETDTNDNVQQTSFVAKCLQNAVGSNARLHMNKDIDLDRMFGTKMTASNSQLQVLTKNLDSIPNSAKQVPDIPPDLFKQNDDPTSVDLKSFPEPFTLSSDENSQWLDAADIDTSKDNNVDHNANNNNNNIDAPTSSSNVGDNLKVNLAKPPSASPDFFTTRLEPDSLQAFLKMKSIATMGKSVHKLELPNSPPSSAASKSKSKTSKRPLSMSVNQDVLQPAPVKQRKEETNLEKNNYDDLEPLNEKFASMKLPALCSERLLQLPDIYNALSQESFMLVDQDLNYFPSFTSTLQIHQPDLIVAPSTCILFFNLNTLPGNSLDPKLDPSMFANSYELYDNIPNDSDYNSSNNQDSIPSHKQREAIFTSIARLSKFYDCILIVLIKPQIGEPFTPPVKESFDRLKGAINYLIQDVNSNGQGPLKISTKVANNPIHGARIARLFVCDVWSKFSAQEAAQDIYKLLNVDESDEEVAFLELGLDIYTSRILLGRYTFADFVAMDQDRRQQICNDLILNKSRITFINDSLSHISS